MEECSLTDVLIMIVMLLLAIEWEEKTKHVRGNGRLLLEVWMAVSYSAENS
jgi:hypothetical protein